MAPFQAGRVQRIGLVAGRRIRPCGQIHGRACDPARTGRRRQLAIPLQRDGLASDGLGFRGGKHKTPISRGTEAGHGAGEFIRGPAKVGIERILGARPMSIKSNMDTSRTKTRTAVRLEFHDRNARVVCIAGTFNGWSPKRTTMVSAGAGRWTKELSLAPGQCDYQYVG